jgi:hypothetical protein
MRAESNTGSLGEELNSLGKGEEERGEEGGGECAEKAAVSAVSSITIRSQADGEDEDEDELR